MIKGYIVITEVKDAILNQVKQSQESKGLPHYWSPGALEVLAGEHLGKWFIPFTDEMIDTVLRDGMKPLDFPEGQQLVAMMGGLEARVELDEQDITKVEE